ncbi:hypothetical protein ANCDUO_26095 [Ancylostoma duodenale]|uniref:Uncharacterized protein n=1 Tax=Ancylostoma duodenale TaxID=51022 RepID=A0A0C2C2W6_9BILA|nr:hypothetical protein ANCDUO_26095 [Ancylostoma duodenale]
MSDAEIDYWRTKYSLLEEQFTIQKNRNEELEERLLHMVEKVESEKKQLADEIDALTRVILSGQRRDGHNISLTRKLELLTKKSGNIENGDADELDEPEDPAMTGHGLEAMHHKEREAITIFRFLHLMKALSMGSDG